MLAILAFVAFVIAGVLRLVGGHGNIEVWCIIIGGLLVSAHCFAYGRAWYRYPGQPGPPA